MIDPDDIGAMAEFVARAVHQAAIGNDDEAWEGLTDEERADFLLIAHAAMGAHDAYLLTHGYVIAKANRQQRRKLITPETRKLIRPN